MRVLLSDVLMDLISQACLFFNVASEMFVLDLDSLNIWHLFCLFFFLGGIALQRKDFRAPFRRRVHCSVQQPPPAWPGRAVPEPGRSTWDGPKPISVLGSTGSIGTQVLLQNKNCEKKRRSYFSCVIDNVFIFLGPI